MSKKQRTRKDLRGIRLIQAAMIAGYALLVIATVAIVTRLAVKKTDTVLKNKVVTMTSSLTMQMKLNLDSYMSRMETIATLAFGERLSYTYDAADPSNDEYDAINKEKTISDRLYSLCIMENFVDYGIVYSNNRTVGKVSNGTSGLFGDHMYDELSSMITDERTEDGWSTGKNGDFRRIYYVKRVHKNAVLFISFYANELNEVFDNPETLSDMQIRLINEDMKMIYSKDSREVGQELPKEIGDKLGSETAASFMDNEYLVSVNKCGDWYVVCSIPTPIILNEKNDMTRYIYMTGAVAALLAALVGLYLSYLLAAPVKSIVAELDNKARTDRLTGILNKLTFEELAGSTLENSLENEHRAMVILDIDDFKGVNDTCGHAAGDRLLENTGAILREVFTDNDYLGRIGGDEFCVLVNERTGSGETFNSYIEERCAALSEAFRENSTARELGHKVSASIGVAVYPMDGRSFEELYSACDKALYRSKKQGKDTYCFYDSSMESEGER